MKGNLHSILQARTKPAQNRNVRALEKARKLELKALVRQFAELRQERFTKLADAIFPRSRRKPLFPEENSHADRTD